MAPIRTSNYVFLEHFIINYLTHAATLFFIFEGTNLLFLSLMRLTQFVRKSNMQVCKNNIKKQIYIKNTCKREIKSISFG